MHKINIKNIYWMLAYAFRSLNEQTENKISTEKFDNIYELFAVMITQELNKQIKRGLNKDYETVSNELSILKGKILINDSIKHNTLIKNKIYCEYDEYSTNSYLNKIIKTACNYLIMSHKIKDKLKINNLKKSLLYLKDVDLIDKKTINWSSIKYNKNNASYKLLTNISYLIIESLLANKEDGNIEFNDYIDDQKMHKLYEKFILEYYRYHHKELDATVSQIDWNVEKNEFIDFLPIMETDIVLTHNKKTLIIDAKYYSNIFQNNPLYEKDTFHSNNLYQIYTYVKNKDYLKKGNVSGMLLYAKAINNDIIDATYNMDGNSITVCNLDLSQEFQSIRDKLEEIANNFKK